MAQELAGPSPQADATVTAESCRRNRFPADVPQRVFIDLAQHCHRRQVVHDPESGNDAAVDQVLQAALSRFGLLQRQTVQALAAQDFAADGFCRWMLP